MVFNYCQLVASTQYAMHEMIRKFVLNNSLIPIRSILRSSMEFMFHVRQLDYWLQNGRFMCVFPCMWNRSIETQENFTVISFIYTYFFASFVFFVAFLLFACVYIWVTKATTVTVSWRLIITCIAFHFIWKWHKAWNMEACSAWICYNIWTVSHSFRFSFQLTRDKRTHLIVCPEFLAGSNLNICNIYLYLSCVCIQC